MKRILILLTITLLSLALFTACTSSADTMPQTSPTASAAPTAAPTTAPTATVDKNISLSPSATQGTAAAGSTGTQTTDTMKNGGVNTIDDAKRISEKIADEVEKLSEIDEAEAVVAGNIALVAVLYDDQYQGGMTDRLRDMVTERVETIDKAITSVHVTDSDEMLATIRELGKALDSAGITFDELQTKLLELGSAITGGGTPQVSKPQSSTGA